MRPVIPAKAGIHSWRVRALDECGAAFKQWIPAFAGMTAVCIKSKGIETDADMQARLQMLRKFGYKL